MTTCLPDLHTLNRRSLLKLGLGATALLATVGLGGCTPAPSAKGLQVLRASDLPMLRALIPVVLEGTAAVHTVEVVLRSLDDKLAYLSPAMLKLTRQLLDVLSLPLTRGPLTGVWGAWDQASSEQIHAFLKRWQHSTFDLLRMGHGSLLQLLLMAWYSLPDAWADCGYPGPPKI